VIAVDTAYDPVIPAWSAERYLALLDATGKRSSFLRKVVQTEGHLNVSVEDRLRAFRTLVEWVREGRRP
jgi:16S rRNA G527 N7-methylase RsmG